MTDGCPLACEDREGGEDPGRLLCVQLEPRVHMPREEEELCRVQIFSHLNCAPDLVMENTNSGQNQLESSFCVR